MTKIRITTSILLQLFHVLKTFFIVSVYFIELHKQLIWLDVQNFHE